MSEDINEQILEELRKIRTISRWLCGLIVIFIIVCAIPVVQEGQRQNGPSWPQVRAAMDRGDFHGALYFARALVAQQPDFAYGRAYLGYVYLAVDDLTNAEIQYSKAYDLFPDENAKKDLDAVRKRIGSEVSLRIQSPISPNDTGLKLPPTAP